MSKISRSCVAFDTMLDHVPARSRCGTSTRASRTNVITFLCMLESINMSATIVECSSDALRRDINEINNFSSATVAYAQTQRGHDVWRNILQACLTHRGATSKWLGLGGSTMPTTDADIDNVMNTYIKAFSSAAAFIGAFKVTGTNTVVDGQNKELPESIKTALMCSTTQHRRCKQKCYVQRLSGKVQVPCKNCPMEMLESTTLGSKVIAAVIQTFDGMQGLIAEYSIDDSYFPFFLKSYNGNSTEELSFRTAVLVMKVVFG
jgi:hypothetical protein